MATKKGQGSSRNGRDSNSQRLGVKRSRRQRRHRRLDPRAPARAQVPSGAERRARQGRHALREGRRPGQVRGSRGARPRDQRAAARSSNEPLPRSTDARTDPCLSTKSIFTSPPATAAAARWLPAREVRPSRRAERRRRRPRRLGLPRRERQPQHAPQLSLPEDLLRGARRPRRRLQSHRQDRQRHRARRCRSAPSCTNDRATASTCRSPT